MHNQVDIRTPGEQLADGLAVRLAAAEATIADLLAGQGQARLRDLIDNLGPSMFVGLMTPDGIMLEANRPALRASGLDVAQVLGKRFDETFWWDHPGPAREQLRAAILRGARGEASRFDTQVKTADGTLLDIDFSLQPLRDESGAVTFLVPSGIVISERKQVEAVLRASNEQFHQLAEHITDVFWIRSPDMREVQYVSPGFDRLWGRPAASLRADPDRWSDFILPEDREPVTRAFQELTRDTPTIDVEYRIARPDGTIRWIRSRGFQVRDPAGTLVRLIGIVTDITDVRETAEALRASLDDFRALAEAMPQMVWIARPDGWNVYLNRQWTDYTGLAPEESAGEAWGRSFHPDDRVRALEDWQEAMRTTSTYSVECRIRRADGVYRWWLVRGVPMQDPEGTILKWIGTCTDIHDLKVAQLEISRTNRALTMLSRCSEAVVRAETELDLLNEVCRIAVEDGNYRMAWVGYARDDEARSIVPMAHAGVDDGFLASITVSWSAENPLAQGPAGQVIRTGQPVVCPDLTLEPRVGHWLTLALERGYRGTICLPLREGERTFGLLVLYAGQVAETGPEELALLSRMADQVAFGIVNLRAQSQVVEQAALLDIANEAIQVIGLDGRISYWNRGAEQVYGWSAAEAVGRRAARMINRDRDESIAVQAALLANGEWQGEMIQRTRDGPDITADVRLTLVRDALGAPKAILALSTDVTRKKILEAQLMVSDRMASVGTLAAGVAHEINNPLAAVIANLDYAVETLVREEGGADALVREELKAPLEDARHAAQRVRLIVRDLKIFSRSPVIEPRESVDVHAVMDTSIRMAWNEIRHRARLVKHFGVAAPVAANEARLGQVFLNLLINAAQALPEGQAENNEIRVSTRLEGNRVVVEVADTGPGIPPETIGRIFDAFFTTKAVGVGTGLGLAISHRIITDMNGELTVESVMGTGTTFRVALPVADALEPDAAAPVVRTVEVGRRGRILLVDDEKLVLDVLTRVLSRDHDVVAFQSAREALAQCTGGESFDLILCDLMMPGMTGMEFHHELERVAPEQARRMIFLTGGAFTPAARQFLADTSREHIEKPFDHANLRAIIRRQLR